MPRMLRVHRESGAGSPVGGGGRSVGVGFEA